MGRRTKFGRDEQRAKLAAIGTLVQHGSTIAEACLETGVTLAMYYRWQRARRSGVSDPAAHVSNLEIENAQLRKLVAELSLEAAMLRDRLTRPTAEEAHAKR